jgi:hypothetical protein
MFITFWGGHFTFSLRLVHTPNSSMAAGTSFAIAYEVCLFFHIFCDYFNVSLVRSLDGDTRKSRRFHRPLSVSGIIINPF